MEIFLTLFIKLLPLYMFIAVGYLCGRFLKIKTDYVSVILLYFLIPVVIFNTTATTPLTLSTITIPILFYLMCGLTSLVTYIAAGYLRHDLPKHLLAFIAGTANTGYLGFAIVADLFGTNYLSIAVLSVLGTGLYFNTIGFLVAAKGNYSTKESLIKLLQLPMLYAFFFGIAASLAGIHFFKIYEDISGELNQLYIFLGMMTIGLALAEIKSFTFDHVFLYVSLGAKFILWPLLMAILLFIDSISLRMFGNEMQKILIIMSLLPVAVNLVPYASYLKESPDKAAVVVLISTIFALFLIPLVAVFI